MSGLIFKKESSLARVRMPIERLLALKFRSKLRLAIMRASKIFYASDIRYVESSIRDLDERINQAYKKIILAEKKRIMADVTSLPKEAVRDLRKLDLSK